MKVMLSGCVRTPPKTKDEEFGSPAALCPTGECYLLIDSERCIFSWEILGVHGSLHHHAHSPPGILGLMGRKLMEQFLAVYPKEV